MNVFIHLILFLFNLSHTTSFKVNNINRHLFLPVKSNSTSENNSYNISLKYLKSLPESKLQEYCDFIRDEFIKIINTTGGHFSSNLGVVELTVALHYVLDTPNDVLIWDIGHQSYIHKMLTGRLHQMHTIRQFGGLSGFCKRDESIFDVFGGGHAGPSLSALEGIALADLVPSCFTNHDSPNKPQRCYTAVVGDGSLASGVMSEALGSIAEFNLPILVIYNDNQQTSLPTGTKCKGKGLSLLVDKKDNKLVIPPGWDYAGPIDGHNTKALVDYLRNYKNTMPKRPTIFHIMTEKGKGYPPSLKTLDRLHSIGPNALTPNTTTTKKQIFSNVFSKALTSLAEDDNKIICITAGMPGGTGVGTFAEKNPDRAIDVGINEQHAVTLAAGLAAAGKNPFCCIYSTFLQRAVDQVIHDVFLQNLPVRFVVDRCGYVGEDGESHHGLYDANIFGALPNGIVMCPINEKDIIDMAHLMNNFNQGPSVIRLPRMEISQTNLNKFMEGLPKSDVVIGKANVIKTAEDNRINVAVLTLGPIIHRAFDAIELVEQDREISFDLVDMRFLRPLDFELLNELMLKRDLIITVEEGPVGGFGSIVSNYISKNSNKCRVYQINTPKIYIGAGKQSEQWKFSGLDVEGISDQINKAVKLVFG